MAVVASISYSLLVLVGQQQEEAAAAPGRHLTLLPRGPAAEQTVGSLAPTTTAATLQRLA